MNIAQKLANFVFPAPRSNRKSSDAHRTDPSPNEANNNRCGFRFSDGRQCRNQYAQFCVQHSSRKQRDFGAEGAPDAAFPRRNVYQRDELSPLKEVGLESLCGDLATATNINRALSHVFLLTAQGRISQKQAVAFGYLSQLLLQTVPGIRSEFVSVHGYAAWEQRLKSSLTPSTDESPEPSPGGDNDNREGQDSPSEGSEQSSNGVVEPEKGSGRERPSHESLTPESHGNQELSRSRKVHQELSHVNESSRESILAANVYQQDELRGVKSSHQELSHVKKVTPLFGHAKVELELEEGEYYADIYRRSLDLLDRKYDTTPEGRSEAKGLLLELELMKPAPAKPRRDFLGQTADLLRRLHEHESEISPPASPARAASPASMPPSPPAAAPPSAPPNPASVPPAMPEPDFCSPGRGATRVPEARRSRAPRGGEPALGPLPSVQSHLAASSTDPADNFVAPPSRRPEPDSAHPGDQRQAPIPGFTLTRVGHSHDWYVPASWSRPRPDPFPSRQEQLKRKLRGNMSDRRWQHQNQCVAFWR